jgi:DNA-binding response OmpR family regulator
MARSTLESAMSGQQRPRALIADDDSTLIELMRDVLQEEFTVETAANGSDAMEKARRIRPDIVVVDAVMPEMNGYQTCRALRRSSETASVPIIMVTGKSGPAEARRAFRAGATDYLPKPFSPSQLRARAHVCFIRAARAR